MLKKLKNLLIFHINDVICYIIGYYSIRKNYSHKCVKILQEVNLQIKINKTS